MFFDSEEVRKFLQENSYVEMEDVCEVLRFTIENLFSTVNLDVIVSVQNSDNGTLKIVDLTAGTPVERPPKWILSHFEYETIKRAFVRQLDRYRREKIYSTYLPFKKRILTATVVGETFHLGRYSSMKVDLPAGYTGSIRDFGEYLEALTGVRVYVESGKEEISIEHGRRYLWEIAEAIYDQTGYAMSINPHRKNLRIKKQTRSILFDLGGVHAIMPSEETIPGEQYRPGDSYEVILYNVSQLGLEGYHLYVSRRQIEFVLQALLREFPEISRKEVLKVARLPGTVSAVLLAGRRRLLPAIQERTESVKKTIGDRNLYLVFNEGGIREILRQMFPQYDGDFVVNHNTAHVIAVTHRKGTIIGKGGLNVKIAGMLTGYRITVYTPDEYMAYLNRLQRLRERYDTAFEGSSPVSNISKEGNQQTSIKEV